MSKPLSVQEERAVSLRQDGLTQEAIAKEMGISRTAVRNYLSRAVAKSMHQGADVGYFAKAKTRGRWYKDEDTGESRVEYIKMDVDKEEMTKMMESIVQGFKDDMPRATPVIRDKKKYEKNLLNLFVITDYHIGMLAWGEETMGEDWDMKRAESLLLSWFAFAIEQSPDADTAIFCQLGDFLHFDGIEAVTPTSNHLLDADTRFAKLIRVVIRVLRAIIQMLLEKFPNVHVKMAEGNHDIVSSMWLREWLAVMYENETRVTVDTSPNPYYAYEWGKTALFFHHGHKRRPANVDTVFTAMFRELFGRTKFAYAHMGHLHHRDVKETNLMEVEQHRTLAANDAHGARGGYNSGREASVTTYHKDFGRVGSNVITPEMVK